MTCFLPLWFPQRICDKGLHRGSEKPVKGRNKMRNEKETGVSVDVQKDDENGEDNVDYEKASLAPIIKYN